MAKITDLAMVGALAALGYMFYKGIGALPAGIGVVQEAVGNVQQGLFDAGAALKEQQLLAAQTAAQNIADAGRQDLTETLMSLPPESEWTSTELKTYLDSLKQEAMEEYQASYPQYQILGISSTQLLTSLQQIYQRHASDFAATSGYEIAFDGWNYTLQPIGGTSPQVVATGGISYSTPQFITPTIPADQRSFYENMFTTNTAIEIAKIEDLPMGEDVYRITFGPVQFNVTLPEDKQWILRTGTPNPTGPLLNIEDRILTTGAFMIPANQLAQLFIV